MHTADSLRIVFFVVFVSACAHSTPDDAVRATAVVERAQPTLAPPALDAEPPPAEPPPAGPPDAPPIDAEPPSPTPTGNALPSWCDPRPGEMVIHNGECTSSPPPPPPPRSPFMRLPVRPPSLSSDGLQTHYPRMARSHGVPGIALVRLTVSAAGELTSIVVMRETPEAYGFGAACRAYVSTHQAGWQPALDTEGNPVAHTFTFRCTFSLDD